MKRIVAVVVLAVLMVLAGCGSDDKPAGPKEYTAPGVVGMSLEQASAQFAALGAQGPLVLTVDNETIDEATSQGKYTVARQRPEPGELTVGMVLYVQENDDFKAAESSAEAVAESYAEVAGKITYTVTGSGSASISYSDASFQIAQDADASLPWSKTIDAGAGSTFVMNAQHMDGSGAITCTVEYEGRVIATNTSSGEYAVVSCNASVD